MKVNVHLFATLRDGRFKGKKIELKEGSTGEELLDILKITENELGIFLVDGCYQETDIISQGGETISLFPPISGG